MSRFTVQSLSPETWEAFAALVERHNGVWGGCWCMGFHPPATGTERSAEANRRNKEERVRQGRAHAALVFEGDRAVGWCQFGSPEELPRIKMRREYEAKTTAAPDWRITCFFTDKECRKLGVSELALRGALEEIASLGGGLVESYPEAIEGQKTSGAFLYNSELGIFERNGFEKAERLGKHHWIVRRLVAAAPR